MTTRENFASFRDQATGKVVYVDSFDNREFNVRYGTAESTVDLGTIEADCDDVLNAKLAELVANSLIKSSAA
jgi:hypothetical protein